MATLPEAAAFFGNFAAFQSANRHHALEKVGQKVEDTCKTVLGTYDFAWQELAPATKEDRLRKGFSENEPGLRTGDMRDSIKHKVHGASVYVGSDDPHLEWFELGTHTQPPRSVLLQGALHAKKEIGTIMAREILKPILRVP